MGHGTWVMGRACAYSTVRAPSPLSRAQVNPRPPLLVFVRAFLKVESVSSLHMCIPYSLDMASLRAWERLVRTDYPDPLERRID